MISKQVIPIMALCTLLLVSSAMGASLDKAKMFRRHGLVSEAKKELIEVIFSEQDAISKAEAYYILGTVAFKEDNISAALDTWTQLIKDFPESEYAKLVRDRIQQLSEVVSKALGKNVGNAIAQSYLRHADFWSEEVRHKRFSIDSSYIPNIDIGISWYDKVIQEFPKTEASRIAYEEKMLTLIGRIHGVFDNIEKLITIYGKETAQSEFQGDVTKFMQQLLVTFSAFERNHPGASSLQAFRYQIAQIYWMTEKGSTLTHKWLNLIIEQAGENYTFYRDLAEWRLESPTGWLLRQFR